MTPTHPRTVAPSAPARARLARVLEAVGATVALLAFTVGIPLVLRVVAPIAWPETWPTWDQVRTAVMRPDDGTLLLHTMALVAWAGWAWFTLAVLLELAGALRRTPMPSIPLLGWTRGAARSLLATAGVLLTTASPLIGSTAAPTQAAIELVLPEQPRLEPNPAAVASARVTDAVAIADRYTPPQPPPTPAPAAPVDRHPVITVQHGDTLWGLAERHLGAGHRFTEILDLNLHRPQPDGRALTDEHWLYPGWQLRLPPDAGALTPPAVREPNGQDVPATHTVVPGDTLWEIAQEHLGDGARYPEIFHANAGRAQPDGDTLTDPDLIRPGWQITIPAATTHLPATPVDPSAPVVPTPPAPAASAPEQTEPRGSAGSVGPRTAEPAPVDQRPDARADDAAPSEDSRQDEPAVADGDEAPSVGTLVLGLTALTAVGIVGELARRRARQRRLRRPGERIALPAQASPAANAEHTLRQAPVPLTPAGLRAGLLRLAATCRTQERPLPRVAVVLISDDAIDLILTADDADAVAPFEPTGTRHWHAPLDSFTTIYDHPGDIVTGPHPYPALVSIGVTGHQLVLVNLEAAGTFAINGPDPVAADVMRALACELATTNPSVGLEIVLGPEYANLAEACPSVSIQHVPSTGDLQVRLHTAQHDDAHVLQHADVADALHARTATTAADTWTPTVFLAPDIDEDVAPWAGHALVTTARPSTWRLDVATDGTGRLEPLGLNVEAQGLNPDDYAALIDALRRATIEPEREPPDAPPDTGTDVEAIRATLPSRPTRAVDPHVASLTTTEPRDDEPPDTPAPRVLVLGPVKIEGIPDRGTQNRIRRHTELITYLALTPGATSADVENVLGNGRRIEAARRNQDVSRARSWLGTAPDGSPYLMKLTDHDTYRLDPRVRTDWDDFLTLTGRGLNPDNIDPVALREALRLVRGRPFAGVPYNAYTWAEMLINDMTAQIVDVAHVLARIELDRGDHRAARTAISTGLAIDPCNEQIFRDAIEAAHRAGDTAEVHRLADALRARIDEIDPGCDLEDETLDLLRAVLL
ncbi:LysM peptidoglycan-binding domain-containing protein [Cellulomonas fimi]|uniref:LysM peptidoglycan-binding domain-containing protein n=1 Tax=Cellulomonas fimi TaxID=1708 RepID=A0A7Y0LWQ0_CELFI|nr:LysM peptidoglycan-binding domain-containing protein [Cellulomonas fimi]NMR19219.1 LysM peptidoglycan-binding domain-containing protein [Cellulomonas fimi]